MALNATGINGLYVSTFILTEGIRRTHWKPGLCRRIKSDRRKGLLSVGSVLFPTSSLSFPCSIMTFSFSSHVWVTFPPNSTPHPRSMLPCGSSIDWHFCYQASPPIRLFPRKFHLYAEAQLSWPAIRWSPAASSLLQPLSAGMNCVLTGREETTARHSQVQYLASVGNTELSRPGGQPIHFSWKAVQNPFSMVAITSKRMQRHNSNNPENFNWFKSYEKNKLKKVLGPILF